MKELGEENGVLVGPDLPLAGEGTEAEVETHSRSIVWVREETFKAESETADLWQPKWNDNQTVLDTIMHALDRNAGLLEGAAAENWSLEIVAQSQGKGSC